jgi:hypothetical protein
MSQPNVKVWTRDSFYAFDTEAGTVTRNPGAKANPIGYLPDIPLKLAALHVCTVGERMYLNVDCDRGNNYPLSSSLVRKIEVEGVDVQSFSLPQ